MLPSMAQMNASHVPAESLRAPSRLLIDGQLRDSQLSLEVVNPATGQVFTACARTTPALLDEAVAAARRAFGAWSGRPWAERAALLLRMADVIERHGEHLAHTLTTEQGKPLAQAHMEVDRSAAMCRAMSRYSLPVEVLQDDATQHVALHRKPLGVVAAIVPWNVPLMQAVYKIAPAILVGNTVVLKAAPTTPLTALLLGELLADLLPPGVVNIISDGGDIGPLLVAHRDVALVSFTGSTATGRAVMAMAAQQLKRVTLELGGNDAAVVFDDVDVAEVAPKIFRFAFFNSGQVCVSIKRIYVQAGVYDAMCDALAALARKARVGDGLLPGTEFGPLQNRRQYEATKGYLELAHRHGKVIAGGIAPAGHGFFVPPTLVRDICEGNALVDEETFGPVRSVLRFDSASEVLARVNATPYGLGASVWSRDAAKAQEMADRIESGIVWINQHLVAGAHVPIAGAKQSGIGVESGLDGLKELTRIHVISRAVS